VSARPSPPVPSRDITEVEREIAATLEQFNKRCLSDERIALHANQIAIIVTTLLIKPNFAFRHATRSGARRRLDELARAADAYARLSRELHQEEVIALANQGILRHDIMSPAQAERLADAARAADVSALPEWIETGRPINQPQRFAAMLTIAAFEELTGNDTSVAGQAGGLVKLARQIFKIGKLPGDPKAAIAGAQEELEDQAAKRESEERKMVGENNP